MAFASLLALLDDITYVLDDVAALTKVAGKKTAGVLGDDLALNAQQVAGVHASRELPVVWAVAKGSLKNKGILVPAALLISAFLPWAVTPLLMLGGLYLCFEGVEKWWHGRRHAPAPAGEADAPDHGIHGKTGEAEKIQGAIRTDFILSAEIIAITLGTVAMEPFSKQLMVLSTVALAMTVFVYGFVAAIVKLDDLGLYLVQKSALEGSAGGGQGRAGLHRHLGHVIGNGLLQAAPWLMKGLSWAGTVAMFLVGGGILLHGFAKAHHAVLDLAQNWSQSDGVQAYLAWAIEPLSSGLVGVVAGLMALGAWLLALKVRGQWIARSTSAR